jgi:hypothetical protein
MSHMGHERRIIPLRNRSALFPKGGRGADVPEPTLSATSGHDPFRPVAPLM